MPTMPPGMGAGLPPEAKRVDGPGPHLAQTGHTVQTHWPEGHQHVFTDKATCDGCGVHIDTLMDGDEVLTMLAM